MPDKKMMSVSMVRKNLDNIPAYHLPSPYTMRWYQPGDDKAWLRIERAAEKHSTISDDLFDREFGKDHQRLNERQCFICDSNGNEIGTATAWFSKRHDGKVYGLVHWVAIIPEEQGKGLAKPLMTAICTRLRDLGYERAYLNTGTLRIPAISLYHKFGFVPEIKDENDIQAWQQVAAEINLNTKS